MQRTSEERRWLRKGRTATNSSGQDGKGRKKINVYFLRNRNFNGYVELPADLWYVIMEYLNLYDQIRILSVCKDFSNQFSLQLRRNVPINRLPWLVEFDTSELHNFTLKMLDPIHKEPYQTLRIREFCPDYVVSKHGWLLLLREKRRRKEIDDSVAELFLISPYTKEIVLLPDLVISYRKMEALCSVSQTRSNTCCRKHRHVQIRATFSMSNPKSEDCVFFVVYLSVDSYEFTICSYQKRISKEWKMKARNIHNGGRIPSISGLEYYKEKLYLLINSDLIMILTYDHSNGVFSRALNMRISNFNLHSLSLNLLILDGSIHIVASFVTLKQLINDDDDDDDDDEYYYPFLCHSSRLLRLKNIENRDDGYMFTRVGWKELGNHRALFLGTSSCDSAFVVEDMSGEELGLFGNKVCFHENCQQMIDLSTGKSEIQRKYFLGLEDEDEDEDEEEDADYGYRRRVWIEPPNQVHFSSFN